MDMATVVMEIIMEKRTEYNKDNSSRTLAQNRKKEINRDFRIVDTEEYMSVLRELTEAGKKVNLLITGNSMSPFLIHLRDQVFFEKPKRALKKGDIVFYQRQNGQYIMHRICKIDKNGYYAIGDAQTGMEGPLRREQIFGLVTEVKRKNRMEKPGTFWWEFFEHVWIHCIPMRPLFRHMYGAAVKLLRRQNRQETDRK